MSDSHFYEVKLNNDPLSTRFFCFCFSTSSINSATTSPPYPPRYRVRCTMIDGGDSDGAPGGGSGGLGSRSSKVLDENRRKQQQFEDILAGGGSGSSGALTAAQIKEENRLSGYLEG